MPLPLRAAVAPLALACLPVHAGCEQLEDGAVEVSWSLYDENGGTTNCDRARIDQIQLWWTVDGRTRNRLFPCADQHGVTGFDLPVGEASLYVAPHCEDGTITPDARTYAAPPAIVRTITAGEVVTLDTQLIQVKLGSCTTEAPCICTQ